MSRNATTYFRICVAVSIIFCTIKTSAQDDSLFSFLKKIEYPLSSFTVDNLGELYTIDIDNQLKKYDEKGDSIGVFNQVTTYGKLSYVVAENPWKVIMF